MSRKTYLQTKIRGQQAWFAGWRANGEPKFVDSRQEAVRFKSPFLASVYKERNRIGQRAYGLPVIVASVID